MTEKYEINDIKKQVLELYHKGEYAEASEIISSLNVNPRWNLLESIDQDILEEISK